jgi:hypothetical protein
MYQTVSDVQIHPAVQFDESDDLGPRCTACVSIHVYPQAVKNTVGIFALLLTCGRFCLSPKHFMVQVEGWIVASPPGLLVARGDRSNIL